MADQIVSYSPAPISPLVGRDRELAVLRDALAAALAGRGSVVLVGGEAGIGKTALAEALGREATSAGASILTGHCFDLSANPPYGPWLDTGLFVPPATEGRLTPERRRILDFLREQRSVRPADLAAGLGITPANAAHARSFHASAGMGPAQGGKQRSNQRSP